MIVQITSPIHEMMHLIDEGEGELARVLVCACGYNQNAASAKDGGGFEAFMDHIDKTMTAERYLAFDLVTVDDG